MWTVAVASWMYCLVVAAVACGLSMGMDVRTGRSAPAVGLEPWRRQSRADDDRESGLWLWRVSNTVVM
jgi:hypothetical protein